MELKKNDVYRWVDHGRSNHCFDAQLLVLENDDKQLVLCDTYWLFYCGIEQRFQYRHDCYQLPQVTTGQLKFVGNTDDYDWRCERLAKRNWETAYAPADIRDISYQHGMYTLVGLRKGAQKSQEVMLSSIRRMIDEYQADARYAQSRIEELYRAQQRVIDGDLNCYIPTR